MEINQNLNRQKTVIDLTQYPLQKPSADEGATSPQGKVSEISTGTPRGASAVNLSREGRTASLTFDFGATTENLAKLDALGNPETFGRSHASISYEKVKNLLD